jgi:uncharacterized protein YlzI (FlbEa/FlbD family)
VILYFPLFNDCFPDTYITLHTAEWEVADDSDVLEKVREMERYLFRGAKRNDERTL